ncbi:MAG TPA: hypothetical protein VN778_00495 [Verrucomicrobiae bacterium]|nr:hypothetical protein [Verrucomicrobiae bacterium]
MKKMTLKPPSPRLLLTVISLIAILSPTLGVAAQGAPRWNTKTAAVQTGNDVSWPQCGKTLPKGQLFSIVGVNDGLANNTNPCLSTELSWANTSTGTTTQPKAALYVSTANPGNLGVADWPTSGTNAYGTCAGGDDRACAYQYGWNMAQADALNRGVPNGTNYKWWLDVETVNSWEINTANNVADLEGMTAYLESVGSTVGVYSTGYQWDKIAGAVNSSSNLYALTDWLPGARSLSGAQSNCRLTPLTAGGQVVVTQYVSSKIDYDYAC